MLPGTPHRRVSGDPGKRWGVFLADAKKGGTEYPPGTVLSVLQGKPRDMN